MPLTTICVNSSPNCAEPAIRPASLTLAMRPRTSAPRGITSTPSWVTGSSRTAVNWSPTLFFSLLTLSINRMTTFEPVGTVHAVFAAFAEVGRVTRSVLGNKRGSDEVLGRDGADVVEVEAEDVEVEDVVALLSSPNWICWT